VNYGCTAICDSTWSSLTGLSYGPCTIDLASKRWRRNGQPGRTIAAAYVEVCAVDMLLRCIVCGSEQHVPLFTESTVTTGRWPDTRGDHRSTPITTPSRSSYPPASRTCSTQRFTLGLLRATVTSNLSIGRTWTILGRAAA